ncbi:MAG: hypothetical protein EOP34_02385 [Rickettsiales bacterium]|nr:MAG: hypothetical protein EOP34_02385 [Rickettsiales bacterium]
MYLTIIILPLLSSIVSGFFGRKVGVTGSHMIACVSVVLTTILSVVSFLEVGVNNIPVYISAFLTNRVGDCFLTIGMFAIL